MMTFIKLAAFGCVGYAVYEWYRGRRQRVPIALTGSGIAFAVWGSRIALRWIAEFQAG